MVETAMHHVGAALTKEELNDKTSLIMQQRDTLETKLNDVQCSLHRSMVWFISSGGDNNSLILIAPL